MVKRQPIDRDILEQLYWGEYKSTPEISEQLGRSINSIRKYLREYGIPLRTVQGENSRFYSKGGGRSVVHLPNSEYPHRHPYWQLHNGGEKSKEHRVVVEESIGRKLLREELVHHKDHNPLNNHPLNLEILLFSEHGVLHELGEDTRPPMFFNYLVFSHILKFRGTCSRLQVGAVITSFNLQEVYALGYNGNASGLLNDCDSLEEGNCGCIHAEENALIKCGQQDKNKILFTTSSPCLRCAKLIINSGFSWVYYLQPYRKELPLSVLHYSGIKTCPYPIIIEENIYGGVGFSWAEPINGYSVCECGCGKVEVK